MSALSNKTTAARTLDRLLDARESQRARASMRKTWGASLKALTLLAPQSGQPALDRAVNADMAQRLAALTLRLAQAEVARDCLRINSLLPPATPREGLWQIQLGPDHLADPDSRFWWSPQFRQMLGFDSVDEFPDVFESWSSRVHPDDRLPAMAAFAAHLHDRTGATPFDVCYRLRCKDGDYRWFRARGQARRSADGRPLSALGVLLEIPSAQ